MKWLKSNWMLVVLVLVACACVSAIRAAWGDDGHGHSHGDDGDATASADSLIDNAVKDSSLTLGLGFSYGMGDVDINEGQNCMGSEQKAHIFAGKQEIVLNAWCASLFYELNGRHTFAAKLRCGIPEIGEHYATAEECVTDQDLSPVGLSGDDAVDLYEEQRAQDEYIAAVQMEQSTLEQRVVALEKQPAPKPRVIQATAPPPDKYSYEQKQAVFAALGIKGDEDE
jgi:hypothetical protein